MILELFEGANYFKVTRYKVQVCDLLSNVRTPLSMRAQLVARSAIFIIALTINRFIEVTRIGRLIPYPIITSFILPTFHGTF